MPEKLRGITLDQNLSGNTGSLWDGLRQIDVDALGRVWVLPHDHAEAIPGTAAHVQQSLHAGEPVVAAVHQRPHERHRHPRHHPLHRPVHLWLLPVVRVCRVPISPCEWLHCEVQHSLVNQLPRPQQLVLPTSADEPSGFSGKIRIDGNTISKLAREDVLVVNLVVLEHVIGVGQPVGVGDEHLPDVSERVLPLAGAANVLLEHAVAGEHAGYPLQVLGITTVGRADLGEDLGSGEWGVGAAGPDDVRDLEADGGIEGHGDADHVGELVDLDLG